MNSWKKKRKGDHEEKDKKKSSDEPSQEASSPVLSPGDPSGITPPGIATQGDPPKDKRGASPRAAQAAEEPEEKQGKTREPGAVTPAWRTFVSSPLVVDHTSSPEASSS